MQSIELRPGHLIVVDTKVAGGIHYHRKDLKHEEQEGRDVLSWETERVIHNLPEFEEATRVRNAARALITGICLRTPFGVMLCPSDRKGELEQRIRDAQALVATFNTTAAHTRVRIVTLRGEISPSDAEAIAALRSEICDALEQLADAIGAADVERIRAVATETTAIAKLLDDSCTGPKAALAAAVKTARDQARHLAKAAEKGVTPLISPVASTAIARARFVFSEDLELGAIDNSTVTVPAISTSRFAFDANPTQEAASA